MNKYYAYFSAAVLFSASLSGCGSSGSSTTTTTTPTSTTGLSLPTEISAVPTTESGSSKVSQSKVSVQSKVGLQSKLMALMAATDAGTDYSDAQTVTFVNEQTLEQFEIIEQVLGALAQTHYADEINIGADPYKSMVSWQDESNGVQTKSLQPWIVESDIIIEDGEEVTRARAWIEQVDQGQKQTIKAEFKIYAAATQDSTGAFTDYGVWTLNVKFGDAVDGVVTDFFSASASIGDDGESIIMLHERFPQRGGGGGGGEGGEGEGGEGLGGEEESAVFVMEVKAILNKSAESGFGKVSFPDWESCTMQPCAPSIVEAKYAYNDTHMAVQKAGEDAPTFKDRSSITEMTHRYGMFNSETGVDVLKTKNFGFPVFYTDSNGFRNYAFYGAWQGRHQLWGGGGDDGVAAGTTVTRDDFGDPTATPTTYTVSEAFVGTLVKRSTVAGDLSDILDIPVETFINKNYNIRWNDAESRWDACVNPSWDPDPSVGQTCESEADFTPTLPLLEPDAENTRKFVNVSGWDQSLNGGFGGPVDYVYLSATTGSEGAGFYPATRDEQTGQMSATSGGEILDPTDGDDMWVNIGGSIYIQYVGTALRSDGVTLKSATGWREKNLKSFDERSWTPRFATGGSPYTLPLNQELYINSRGTNYIVLREIPEGESEATTTVELEVQTVANPLNATTFVVDGTVFRSQWDTEGEGNDSTYTFDTDSTSDTFLKLLYASIGSNDKNSQGDDNSGAVVGSVVTNGQWGLVAYVDGDETETQFNWDYPREGENFGKLTYLKDTDGAYVLLSDPIRMLPVALTNNGGRSKTLSLQYDGWMGGLPDLFEELRKKEFVMDATISDKIINIPAGTQVTDASDSTLSYLIKPLETSQFLNPVDDPGTLDITVADDVDLSTVPDYVEHSMGDTPTGTTTKYSEGILLE